MFGNNKVWPNAWHKLSSRQRVWFVLVLRVLWPLVLQSSSSSKCLSTFLGQPRDIISPTWPRSALVVSSESDMARNTSQVRSMSLSVQRQGRSPAVQLNSLKTTHSMNIVVMYLVHVLVFEHSRKQILSNSVINLMWTACAVYVSFSDGQFHIRHFCRIAVTARIINATNHSQNCCLHDD